MTPVSSSPIVKIKDLTELLVGSARNQPGPSVGIPMMYESLESLDYAPFGVPALPENLVSVNEIQYVVGNHQPSPAFAKQVQNIVHDNTTGTTIRGIEPWGDQKCNWLAGDHEQSGDSDLSCAPDLVPTPGYDIVLTPNFFAGSPWNVDVLFRHLDLRSVEFTNQSGTIEKVFVTIGVRWLEGWTI